MKKILLLISVFIFLNSVAAYSQEANILNAQKIITLSVNQPPEFGFSVSNTETTIVKGGAVVLGENLVVNGGSGIYTYKWSPGKTLNDSTILNPVATPKDTTRYMLSVTDKNGCSFSVGYRVYVREQTVGNKNITTNNSLEAVLFPNPNSGQFKVKLSGKQTDKIELTIYDSNGRLIKKQTVRNFLGEHSEVFNLYLTSGAYNLEITNGKEVLNKQFIIN